MAMAMAACFLETDSDRRDSPNFCYRDPLIPIRGYSMARAGNIINK